MIILKRSLTLFGKTARPLQNSPSIAARILLSLRTALPALCDFFLLFSKNTLVESLGDLLKRSELVNDLQKLFLNSYFELLNCAARTMR
jgi:hypothetical protein